jgi:hypothetical protein
MDPYHPRFVVVRSGTEAMVRELPNREACLRLMAALADLILYTAWDASDVTQMD